MIGDLSVKGAVMIDGKPFEDIFFNDNGTFYGFPWISIVSWVVSKTGIEFDFGTKTAIVKIPDFDQQAQLASAIANRQIEHFTTIGSGMSFVFIDAAD